MLADVDAWGIDEMRSGPGAPDTIEGLLAAFYGAPQLGGPGQGPRHTGRRTRALERFLEGYGLTTTAPLKGQAAWDEMAHQIHLFARVLLMSRRYFKSEEPELETDWVGPMTDMFLEFLERLVRKTGAFVPPGESEPAEASGGR